MTETLIALGSNLCAREEDPESTLGRALDMLRTASGIAVQAVSGWYSSPAFPPGSGPAFVNGAAVLDTALAPEDVLAVLHGVEARLGRKRLKRWGPRVCDLDLLARGDAVIPDRAIVERWMRLPPERAAEETPDRLILPHPRMHERAFVLVPLAGIAPHWRHPLLRQSVAEMLSALPEEDRAAVRPL